MNSEHSDEHLETLLGDILEVYGYDFTGYSRASLKRRIVRLYQLDHFVSFAEFRYKIRTEPGYFKRFLEEVTINVTEMFRDPSFYKTLRTEILPKLGTYPFIRIWVAGCSTGEEAYSIAIFLKELNLLHKSLIYATDINSAVLENAAQAMIPLSKIKLYTENYIAAGGSEQFSDYYAANYSLGKLKDELKSKIIFSTHNLVTDNSFNEFQLILCRNVIIYFDRPLQNTVFELFDNSLEKRGYLALGTKETLDFSSISKNYERLKGEKIWRKIH
ncbi:protein-glutamate O-methyltransferase CheR [Chryseobacterium manosquense]|uniref:Protein-glutamate O-methyltransferase CheR n=1 Tax=Chryseobacterium manosquense TaxID=2754694 RepID=A0A7H1DTB7_9FLAO|nr:protein-glutamate O-methyltransferase CheR [Chryseobacterium manosquense]QNS40225.1 protein-glutamate O-methyltransferase CheR [Chryseobacterium manosquense]ROI07223.1 protein-glutamate O-methyltransferase CheR [Kaistella haifensis]